MKTRATLIAVVTSTVLGLSVPVGGQGGGGVQDVTVLPKSSGFLMQMRDGTLLIATGARINQKAGKVDTIGSFLVGLGGAAPDFDSAALSLMRFTPQGGLDPRFGNGGVVLTPLLPPRNRNRATVTSFVQDSAGRLIVVGYRDASTALDANFEVMVAARYTAAGAPDTSFGERGIATTRLNGAGVTQAFAAAVDATDRILVAGYSGGTKSRDPRDSFGENWSAQTILLRYTTNGMLDPSFGDRGVVSQSLDPSGSDRTDGREFLRYDPAHLKAAALILDRQGRAVVAASNGQAPALLMRYTPNGSLDATFGTAGMTHTPNGASVTISSLLRDAEGRLLAVGRSGDRMILLRYSADGVHDLTFGEGGISTIPMDSAMRVSAALQDANGGVLAVASGENGVLLGRFDRRGLPDKTFGAGGVTLYARKWLSTAAGLAIDVGGVPTVAVPGYDGISVVRFAREGPLDLSFRPTTTSPTDSKKCYGTLTYFLRLLKPTSAA